MWIPRTRLSQESSQGTDLWLPEFLSRKQALSGSKVGGSLSTGPEGPWLSHLPSGGLSFLPLKIRAWDQMSRKAPPAHVLLL